MGTRCRLFVYDHKQILIIDVWLLPGYVLPVVIALLVVGYVVLVTAGCLSLVHARQRAQGKTRAKIKYEQFINNRLNCYFAIDSLTVICYYALVNS